MIGRSLTASFIPGVIFGTVYLTVIMWWVTGYTPADLINAVADTIIQPLQLLTEVFK